MLRTIWPPYYATSAWYTHSNDWNMGKWSDQIINTCYVSCYVPYLIPVVSLTTCFQHRPIYLLLQKTSWNIIVSMSFHRETINKCKGKKWSSKFVLIFLKISNILNQIRSAKGNVNIYFDIIFTIMEVISRHRSFRSDNTRFVPISYNYVVFSTDSTHKK